MLTGTQALPLKFLMTAYLPSFVLTWPISQLPYPDHFWMGFDPQGLRLLATTIVSFYQWKVLLRAYLSLSRKLRIRDGNR